MPTEPALVSVLLPVYNAQDTLDECLQSVLNQSYTALEVIAVDDGSTDRGLDVLDRYAQTDPRVRVFHIPNGGVAAARNYALSHATGEYVQFVDSDDVLPAYSTQSLVSAMRDRSCDLALAPFTEVARGKRKLRGFLKADLTLTQHQFLDKLCAHPNGFFYAVLWNKLYKRELITQNDIRFDTRLPWGEDFAFNMCYNRHALHVAVLSQPVYDYRRNPGGLSGNSARLCLSHPLFSLKVKYWLLQYYQDLYRHAGLYDRYRHVLPQYYFKFTLND